MSEWRAHTIDKQIATAIATATKLADESMIFACPLFVTLPTLTTHKRVRDEQTV